MVSPVFVMLALRVFAACLLGIGWHWCAIWLNEEIKTSIGKELSQTDATVSTPGQVPTFLQYTLQSSYSHSRILKAKQVFGWWQFNHIDTSTCRSNQQKRPTQLELTKLTFSTISHQTLSPTEVPGLHDSVEGEELGINIAVQKTVGFRVVSNDF